jgi:hypothetical protein
VGKKTTQAAAPPPAPASGGLFARFSSLTRFGNTRGRIVAALAILCLMLVAARLSWNRFAEPTLNDPAYQLTAEEIVVTPQPAWIQGDVKAEVFRDAQLANLNLRDRQLLDKINRAFALHSWVAKVNRVEKSYPSRLMVELEYRRPVATVEIGEAAGDGERGLLFIDQNSVLLPSENFSPAQARAYLRISAGDVLPTGVYGTAWGSGRILGAAQVAHAWGDRWQPLGLYRVVIKEDPNAEPIYELHTKGGARVIWGNPPSHESTDEPTATEKIEQLTQYVAQHGALDKSPSSAPVDLRHGVKGKPPIQSASKPQTQKKSR